MPRALLCPGDLALSSRSAAGALLPFQEIWLFHRLRAKQPSRIHQQLYHRAKRCGQEVTATPRTARCVATQPRCSLHRVIAAAWCLPDSLHSFVGSHFYVPQASAVPRGKPPSSPPGRTSRRAAALALLGNPLLPSWPHSPLRVCSTGASPGWALQRAGPDTSGAATRSSLPFLSILKWGLGRSELPLVPGAPDFRGEHPAHLPCL